MKYYIIKSRISLKAKRTQPEQEKKLQIRVFTYEKGAVLESEDGVFPNEPGFRFIDRIPADTAVEWDEGNSRDVTEFLTTKKKLDELTPGYRKSAKRLKTSGSSLEKAETAKDIVGFFCDYAKNTSLFFPKAILHDSVNMRNQAAFERLVDA